MPSARGRISSPSPALTEALRAKTWLAHERLDEAYGPVALESRREPMHELISTMLSHRTTHADESKAYYRMREQFGSWENIATAPLPELIEAISSSRFPEVKAPNIQRVLRIILEERGEANIDFLRNLSTEEGMAWLTSLPGVGLKTASLVLLFSFHKPILPVDTHVHRVSQRLGLIGPTITAEKAHSLLLDMLPKDARTLYNFHVHFLWHGQRVCIWAAPRCSKCVLRDICDWYQTNRKPDQAGEPAPA